MKDINMNYLDNKQKEKMEKIFNLQNSIEASKEKQEERISSLDDYLINNKNNKVEEEIKMKKMMVLKKQKDKKKLEKKMNDWIHKQEKISEENLKNFNSNKNKNDNDNEEPQEDNNNNYNEQFDVSKYNVVSLDNLTNDNNEKEKEQNEKKDNINNNETKDIICEICRRKFPSLEKLALHEKMSELHKRNLNKLKLNNN